MADLSADQMEQMLLEAAERMKNARPTLDKKPSESTLAGISSLRASKLPLDSYVKYTEAGAVVDSSYLVKPAERKLANGVRTVVDAVTTKADAAKALKANAGAQWYNLPRTELTTELKRDLQLLKMRSVLDPHRHYKKDNRRSDVPEFSQVGTIIEGPTEYFSGRLSNKERKRTLVEETMVGERNNGKFKTKYNAIQAAKSSGRKDHYKKMKALRRKGAQT